MLNALKDFLRTWPRFYDALRPLDWRYPPGRAFLRDFSRSHNGRVTFLQIGANDGLRNDPIREFVVRARWSGLFVEPLPDVFALLQQNYRYLGREDLVFVNAAISSSGSESLSFWTFRKEFLQTLSTEEQLDYLRKSSFDKQHLLKFLDKQQKSADCLQEVQVPCLSVHELIEKHWKGAPIDLLAIDAEGHEPAILAGIDFNRWKPRAIFFESHHLGAEKPVVLQQLTNVGYRIRELGGDTAAVLDT